MTEPHFEIGKGDNSVSLRFVYSERSRPEFAGTEAMMLGLALGGDALPERTRLLFNAAHFVLGSATERGGQGWAALGLEGRAAALAGHLRANWGVWAKYLNQAVYGSLQPQRLQDATPGGNQGPQSGPTAAYLAFSQRLGVRGAVFGEWTMVDNSVVRMNMNLGADITLGHELPGAQFTLSGPYNLDTTLPAAHGLVADAKVKWGLSVEFK